MNINLQALRISPRYTSRDWSKLLKFNAADWPMAAAIVRDRLEGRFLKFTDSALVDPFSGFVVLAIDSLLAETIQQFRTGDTTGRDANGKGRSKRLVTDFLSGLRFQPAFDVDARIRFYEDIRCGLLHQAEAKRMWLVRRGEKTVGFAAVQIAVTLKHRRPKTSRTRHLSKPCCKQEKHNCIVSGMGGAVYPGGLGPGYSGGNEKRFPRSSRIPTRRDLRLDTALPRQRSGARHFRPAAWFIPEPSALLGL